MGYLIRTSLKNLWRNRFMTLIHVLCLTLGILVAAIFICQANGAYDSYSNYKKYMNLDKVITLMSSYPGGNIIQLQDLDKIKKEFDFIEDIFVLNRMFERIIRAEGNYISGLGVYTAAEGFDSCFNEGYLLKGNWIQSSTDCIIGKKAAEKYKLDIGDSIEAGINSYKVSGIIDIAKYNEVLFINEKSIADLELKDSTYYIKMRIYTRENIDALRQYIQKNYSGLNLKESSEVFGEEKDRLYRGWGPSIFIAVVALIYGLLNIKNIQSFYIEQTKSSIAIMIAYGANHVQILIQKIMQNSVLALISSIFVMYIVYLLQFTKLNIVFNLKVDIKAFLMLLSATQVISLLFSSYMYRKLLNKQVTEILREQV